MSAFQFLRCREAWLTGILDDLDQRNPYEYLKGMVNCHRTHLFDVVNQYRAIFADDTSGNEENYDGGLLFDWAMHQITLHLKTLKVMLPKISDGGSLSNILDQCMVSISYLIPQKKMQMNKLVINNIYISKDNDNVNKQIETENPKGKKKRKELTRQRNWKRHSFLHCWRFHGGGDILQSFFLI